MYREPVWNDENINKEKGSTTFSECGWCDHRGSGAYRYNCMINGRCDLMSDYEDKMQYDTKCKLKNLGKADIESIIESKKSDIEVCNNTIKRKEKEIEILSNLSFDDIPSLPDNRKYDCFNIDDEIMMYVDNSDFIIKNQWLHGKVINGYRHHDGCVSVEMDDKIHNGDYLNGHGSGMGYCSPLILLKTEYDWFVDHPKEFRNWIAVACDKSFNGKYINSDDITNPSNT